MARARARGALATSILRVGARFAAAVVALAAPVSSNAGCASAPSRPMEQIALDPPRQGFASSTDGPLHPYRSERLHLRLPLPDRGGWRIEDQQGTDLVAEHAASHSRLVVRVVAERDVVGHVQCEARARSAGFVPEPARVVDSADVRAPGDFDTRVVVSVAGGEREGAPMVGYVVAAGGRLRRCLLVRYESRIDSQNDEAELSARLAVVRARVIPAIELDPVLEPVIPRAPRAAAPR